jgi:thioredoxin reductase (NADPH)
MIYDAIIVGVGPAGCSAAIYLTRQNFNVLLIGKAVDSQLYKAHEIENYYGFRNGISGEKLITDGINQVKRLGATVVEEQVINIKNDEFFEVKTEKNSYQSKTILFATGKAKASLRVKGFNSLVGKGISQCVLCDGFFFRNKEVAIIGSGAYLKEELHDLTTITNKITVFTNDEIEGFPVIKEDIVEFMKPFDKVIIKTTNNSYHFDGVFIALDNPGAQTFASKLGITMENNNIIVDENYMTNIDGIFAAGDIVGGLAQIFKAVYDGSNAGLKMISYLRKKK